ncbi:ROK family protein [Stakelama sediminis]|uniref:fructokinase n=1 Tax=Stakelama sediminis TaxID=463200 RepID=A0A840YXF9_9SPHN|nr:ROK family protein [Stakelama sediminis]MBB5718237.1 fructokinase [Stakelama sediminis]
MNVDATWSAGRERQPLAGVELGGTKCICTLATGPDAILDQETIATTTPWETLPAIVETLENWQRSSGFSALGIASFGPLDLNERSDSFGHILATNKEHWPNADLLGTLKAHFDLPIGFDTDVNGAALAEIRWGSGVGMDDFAYVTVGTGVGVGLIVHGRPTRGLGHSEIGHLRVPRFPGDDARSVCRYHADCIEGLASGTALKSRLDGREISDLMPDDPIWDAIVHYLAIMAHDLVCATGPLRIAMGGGVVSGQPHLLGRVDAALRESMAGYMPLPDDGPYIVAPKLGTMAGPLGSIALGLDALDAAAQPLRRAAE